MWRWWYRVRAILCPLCDRHFPVGALTSEQALARYEEEHLSEHVAEMMAATQVKCARCQRLENAPKGVPHRACFLPDCFCPCSYPAQEA